MTSQVILPLTGVGDATATIAVCVVSAVDIQIIKLADGTAGSNTLIPGGATGLFVQVKNAVSLAAGTANIGNVSIAGPVSLAAGSSVVANAGTGNFQVSVVAGVSINSPLPAGTNNIGGVSIVGPVSLAAGTSVVANAGTGTFQVSLVAPVSGGANIFQVSVNGVVSTGANIVQVSLVAPVSGGANIFQVSVVAGVSINSALPAGTANIGGVSIVAPISLAANTSVVVTRINLRVATTVSTSGDNAAVSTEGVGAVYIDIPLSLGGAANFVGEVVFEATEDNTLWFPAQVMDTAFLVATQVSIYPMRGVYVGGMFSAVRARVSAANTSQTLITLKASQAQHPFHRVWAQPAVSLAAGSSVVVGNAVSLAAGAAAIGTVSITAGTANIGGVSLTGPVSLAAGAAAIGTVSITAGTANIGGVSLTGPVSLAAGSAAIGTVSLTAGTANIGGVSVVAAVSLAAGSSVVANAGTGNFQVSLVAPVSGGTNIFQVSVNGVVSTGANIVQVSLVAAVSGGANIFQVSIVGAVSGAANIFQTSLVAKVCVEGLVASSVADSGNPIKIGGLAKNTEITQVTDGQRVNATFDLSGKQVIMPWSVPENFIDSHVSQVSVTADQQLFAAQGSGVRVYMTHFSFTNSDASVGTWINLKDGGSIKASWFAAAAGGGAVLQFSPPLRFTANTGVTVACETTLAAVRFNGAGFKAP